MTRSSQSILAALAIVASSALFLRSARGQPVSEATSVEDRLRRLEGELSTLRKENQQLRQDLGLDGRAAPPVVKPAGRESSLTLGGILQVQADALDKGDARFTSGNDRFYLRRARINTAGHFLENVDFRLELELGSALGEASGLRAQMTDAYVNWTPSHLAAIRVGQFKTSFGFEQLASDPKLFTIERSLGNDRLTLGRQIGAQISGDFLEKHASYATGVFNGSGVNTSANDNDAFLWTGRLSALPWEGKIRGQEARWTIGANVFASKDTNSGSQPVEFGFDSTPGGALDNIFSGQRRGVGLDAQFHWGNFDFWTEYLRTRFQSADDLPFDRFEADGWYVQAMHFVVPKELQIVAKFDSFDPDRRVSGDSTDTWTIGLNYLMKGDDLKLQLDYLLTNAAGLPDRRQKLLLRLQTLF